MAHDNNAPAGWKNLDDFRDGLAEGLQPETNDLDNSTQTFNFPDLKVSFNLANKNKAVCQFNGEEREAKVKVFKSATDVYFLGCEFINPANEDITIIFNTKTYRALAIHATAREKPVAGEERVVQQYKVGTLEGGIPTGFVPCPTNELTGQRLLITYDKDHMYEQIFLNSHRYCWHCVKGEQYGDAASERCTYYKFDENLYMYSWREMLIPCGTTYLLNYNSMVALGKFIGWTSEGEMSHSYAGGNMDILSTTKFPNQCPPY